MLTTPHVTSKPHPPLLDLVEWDKQNMFDDMTGVRGVGDGMECLSWLLISCALEFYDDQ